MALFILLHKLKKLTYLFLPCLVQGDDSRWLLGQGGEGTGPAAELQPRPLKASLSSDADGEADFMTSEVLHSSKLLR